MSGTLKIGSKTLATHNTSTNVVKIQLGSANDVVLTDSAGNSILTENGSVVTLNNVDTATIGSNALVVDSSGKVGIGTNSPQDNLHIVESTTRQLRIEGNAPSLYFKETDGSADQNYQLRLDGGAFSIQTNNDAFVSASTKLSIDSSGNVKIGGNLRLTHIGGYPALVGDAGTGGIAINVNQPGIVPATTSGEQDNTQDLGRAGIRWDDVYATNGTINTSDANEKEDITTSDLSLDFIKELNPVSYRFIGKTRTHYGLIAQEIETLLSTIGKETTDFAGFIKSPLTDDDGNETSEYKYGLRYHEFISPMIKAIQEQQTIIESQQSQIDALTARIEALEAT